jgi:hypothetical protein
MLRHEYLIYRLKQSSTGRSVLGLFETHYEEVDALVKTYRNIAVTWNRNHGPKFISEGLAGAADQDIHFIGEIEGVKLGTLIRKMAAVFLNHASPGLSRSIEVNVPILLGWASSFKGLNDVFEHLKEDEQPSQPVNKI